VATSVRTGRPSAVRGKARLPRALRFAARTAWTYLPPLLLLAALLAAWEAWIRIGDVESYKLPAPTGIWDAFMEPPIRETLPRHTRVTVTEALLGLLAAIAIALPLALTIASLPLVRRVLYPLLVVSQTIPMIVLAPLLIIWFGFGLMPKVVVVALVGFFPIVVSTVEGLGSADPDMAGLVRSMGASRWQVMRHVSIPAAIPAFFSGLKIAAAYAVTAAVFGEWIVADEGLGVLINRSRAAYRVDRVFVAITVIALTSIALFALVHLLARLASPWMYVRKEDES
jgi:ABC-type nitrate/sulfonate/bicarbonate transport system permease component